MNQHGVSLALICRVHLLFCALPLAHVVEAMRPLPVNAVAGAPHFVRGLAMIRGVPVPVIDAAQLLGVLPIQANRFVTMMVGERCVALAVDTVLGVRAIPSNSLQALPPLLKDAGADVVAAIGRLDAEMLLMLNGSRLMSEDVWAGLDVREAAA